MSGFLDRIAARVDGSVPVVHVRAPSRFEQPGPRELAADVALERHDVVDPPQPETGGPLRSPPAERIRIEAGAARGSERGSRRRSARPRAAARDAAGHAPDRCPARRLRRTPPPTLRRRRRTHPRPWAPGSRRPQSPATPAAAEPTIAPTIAPMTSSGGAPGPRFEPAPGPTSTPAQPGPAPPSGTAQLTPRTGEPPGPIGPRVALRRRDPAAADELPAVPELVREHVVPHLVAARLLPRRAEVDVQLPLDRATPPATPKAGGRAPVAVRIGQEPTVERRTDAGPSTQVHVHIARVDIRPPPPPPAAPASRPDVVRRQKPDHGAYLDRRREDRR